MSVCRRAASWLVFMMLLAGSACETPRTEALFYQAPDGSEGALATISGVSEQPILAAPNVSFPFAIDGRRVENAAAPWNIKVPVSIRAEPHVITVEFNNQAYLAYYARADVNLDARPGVDYSIRFTTDLGKSGGPTFCEFWIVDARTGAIASAVVRANLVKRTTN